MKQKIDPNQAPVAARYFIDLALGDFFTDEDEQGRDVFFQIIVTQKDDRIFNFYCETFEKCFLFGYVGRQKRKIFDKTLVLPLQDELILEHTLRRESRYFTYYGRFDHVDDFIIYKDEDIFQQAFDLVMV